MAQDERDEASVARGVQHVLHRLPYDASSIPAFLGPALARTDATADTTQLVILTPDTETALDVGAAGRTDAHGVAVVALTGAARGARVLRAGPAPAVAGTPGELLSLVRASALKLENVRTVVIAWADEILALDAVDALEALLAEVPKEAMRVLVAGEMSTEIEALAERYLRRARRVGVSDDAAEQPPVSMHYAVATGRARPSALRRLLDNVDPPSAAIIVRSDASEADVRETLATLGYRDESIVRVTRGPVEPNTSLVVFYDTPLARAELAEASNAAPVQLVALVGPRQLPSLRALLNGGELTPVPMSPAAQRARTREESLRAELRTTLAADFPTREVIALEPLLEEYEGVEIAAAVLRLLERERGRARRDAKAPEPSAARKSAGVTSVPASGGSWTRVFFNVGDRDGVRPGDFVGAITGESGITSDRLGRIDVRESHAVIEVANEVADQVIERMTGAAIRGRRVVARIDSERRLERADDRGRGERSARPRDDRGRGEPGRGTGRRDDRGRGERPFGGRPNRSDRGGGGRFGGGERPGPGGRTGGSRGGGGRSGPRPRYASDDVRERRPREERDNRDSDDRAPRAIREREEWAERGERVRNARRARPDDERE